MTRRGLLRPLGLACAVIGLAIGPAAAQSPAPDPASTTAPATAPGTPSIATPSLDPETAAAEAACRGLLTPEAVTAATGQKVVSSSGGSVASLPGLPDAQMCGYTLEDGSGYLLTSHWDATTPGESAAIKWGPANGGFAISGLPSPAYGTTFPDGRRGIAWTPQRGPLLTLVLDLEGWLADGSVPSFELLEAVASAGAGQMATAAVDPGCTALLAVVAVSSQRVEPAPGQVACGFDLGGGKAIIVRTEERSMVLLPDCCDKVPELGKGAFAQRQGSGRKAPWRIEWILRDGDPALVGIIQNGPAATKLLGKAALIEFATQVTP
jgi:hypothetical protein